MVICILNLGSCIDFDKINPISIIGRELKLEGVEMLTQINSFMKKQGGGGLVEYGLILALIAVVAIGALTGIGTKMNTTLTAVSTALH